MSIPENSLLVKNRNFNNENQQITYEDQIDFKKYQQNNVLKDLTNHNSLIKISSHKRNSILQEKQSQVNLDQISYLNSNKFMKQKNQQVQQQFSKQSKLKKQNILLQFSQSESSLSSRSSNKQNDKQELKYQKKQNNIKKQENIIDRNKKKYILDVDGFSDSQNSQQLLNQKYTSNSQKFKIQAKKKPNIFLHSFNDSEDQSIDDKQKKYQKKQQMQVIKLLNIRKFESQNYDYLNKKIPQNTIFQCLVKRQKSSSNCEYHLYDSTAFKHILSVRKGTHGLELYRKCFGKQANEIVAILDSNFFGTQFKAFKGVDKKNQQVAINYETNILGLKGPRKMSVYLPFDKNYGEQSLQTQYNKMNNKNIRKFINKPPKWNKQIAAYVLNFKGRATHSSVKNFLLVDQGYNNNKNYILFGKAGKQVFNLDIIYPFTIIQGISVAISSFEKKIGCQ